MKTSLKLLSGAVLAASCFAATSASAEVSVSGNVTYATDYTFRGVSQTNEKNAIQGGFDLDFGNGFYAGTWASNVNFGTETSTETDFYAGYAFDVAEGVTVDLSYYYFLYAGDESDFNYSEFVANSRRV